MNQQLIDYTVRNITTGDEEDIRVLELNQDEVNDFPEAVRTTIAELIAAGIANSQDWHSTHQETILRLLLPYISDRVLYDQDYAAWENNVLEGRYEHIFAEAGVNDQGRMVTPERVILCSNCGARPAEFTVDWPADGDDVCSLCLPNLLRQVAEYGHEWPQTFEGQYPRFLKVTPRA